MKLYRSISNPTRWFAFDPTEGWVMFPAETGGWQRREPARGMDPIEIREVSPCMGHNTGIPYAPILVNGGPQFVARGNRMSPGRSVRIAKSPIPA